MRVHTLRAVLLAVSMTTALGCGGLVDGAPDVGDSGADANSDGGTDPDGGTVPDGGETPDSGPTCEDSHEPNDADADAAELSTFSEGCLEPGDIDVFRLRSSSTPGIHTILISSDSGARVEAEVSAVSGEKPGLLAAQATGSELELWWATQVGVEYWIRLEAKAPAGYAITASWQEVVDALEPDDTPEDATPLQLDERKAAWMFAGYADNEEPSPGAIADWYFLDLTAGAVDAYVIGGPAPECAVDFQFWYGGALADVVWDSGSGPNAYGIHGQLVNAGAYSIRVALPSWDTPEYSGVGSERPCWAREPYEILVVQP